MKLIKESLNEATSDLKTVEVKVRNAENLKKILECIKGCGNVGHSFEIVIDPEKSDVEERTFFWDGDGSDYIESIEIK